MGQKIKIYSGPDDTVGTTIDLEKLDPEMRAALDKNLADPNTTLRTKIIQENINVIPLIKNILSPGTEEAIKKTGSLPIQEVQNQGNKFLVGALGGAGGGLGTALGGGVLNMLLGKPSETFTDAVTDILGSIATGGLSNKVAALKGLQSIPRQAISQGLTNAIGTGATGASKSWLDAYLDPERKTSEAPIPSVKELAPSALLGMFGGGASQYAKNRLTKGPMAQSTSIFNDMTGENQSPPDVATRMKEIQQGKSPNAVNTLAPVIRDEQRYQQKLASEMDDANVEKFLAKDNKYQELEKNKQELAKTIIEQRRTSPKRAVVNEEKFSVTKDLQDLQKKLIKTTDPEEIKLIRQDIEATNLYLNDIDMRLSQISEQAEQLAVDKINRRLNSPEFEGTTYPENKAAREANTAKEQANIKLIGLKREATKGPTHNLEVSNLIKSAKSPEDLNTKLLQADPATIKSFMDTAGKKFPNIQEGIIGETLRQSWDGKTFGNFSKLFGDEGTGGNLGARLTEILGDDEKAYRVIDSIALLDKGLKTNQAIDKAQRSLLNISGLTLMFKLTGLMGSSEHTVTGSTALAASELGTMAVLSIPKLIDSIMTDKKKYETFKKWADSGFNSKLISMSEPLFQSIMDLGDHYSYDEDGNPELTGKKRKKE